MPYHQADIRDQEVPRMAHTGDGPDGAQRPARAVFTRYGYADLLREDRRYSVRPSRLAGHAARCCCGAIPLTAAAYSRAFRFCGSDGRRPDGAAYRSGAGADRGSPGRSAAATPTHRSNPRLGLAEVSLYCYRVWGRLMYNPRDVEGAIRGTAAGLPNRRWRAPAAFCRLSPRRTCLPPPTTATGRRSTPISQSWTRRRKNPYTDTPAPKVFGNISPLDPQLFSPSTNSPMSCCKGTRSGKYSPVEVAQWLEDLAASATLKRVNGDNSADFLRLFHDVAAQAMLGNFFGAKLRAGVLYRIHERTGDRTALEEALKTYRRAREAWSQFAESARHVYTPDIVGGELPWLRGHWLDRVPAIDGDIADMAGRLNAARAGEPSAPVRVAIAAALGKPRRPTGGSRHTPPVGFHSRQPVQLALTPEAGVKLASVRLWYRRVTQAERWQSVEMQPGYRASIPADYTDSPFPLQYYFELRSAAGEAWLHPGFGPELVGQPYFVLRKG